MDDCRALVLLDFGGRIDFEWDAEFRRERVGDVPTEMFRHFFHSLCCAARCNLQISARGGNDHHKAEAIFKAFARALRMAVARTGFGYDIPSSKGSTMIAITDYDTGNLRSVANALRRIGAEFTVTSDAAVLRQADRVLLPGVGEASSAMAKLRERGLDALIPTLTQPVLGICIGMQLMCLDSEEGDTRCLGIFPTHVVRLPSHGGRKSRSKIPHVGWDTISRLRTPAVRRPRPKTPTSTTSTPSRRRRATQRSPRTDYGGTVQRRPRARQLLRHAVPPRKERAGGRADTTQFPKTLTT